MDISTISYFENHELRSPKQKARNIRGNVFRPKLSVRIGTWNVQTLSHKHPGRAEILAMDLENHGVQIAGLTEVRMAGSGHTVISSLSTSYHLYFSGAQKDAINGVGIAVSAEHNRSVVSFNPVNDRLATLRLQRFAGYTTVICCYAPTEPSPPATKDDFYLELADVFSSIPGSDMILMVGDMNAEIGRDPVGWEATRGCFGSGNLNDNGLRLLQFCSTRKLRVANSYFRHKAAHRLTWYSNNQRTKKMLDYVIINHRFRTAISDVRVKRGTSLPSDHELVIGDITLRLKAVKSSSKPRKIDVQQLTRPEVQQRFCNQLNTAIASIPPNINVDDRSEALISAMYDSGVSAAGFVKHKASRFPLSAATLTAIDEKKATPCPEKRKLLTKDIRRNLRRDENRYLNDVSAKLENAFGNGDAFTFYQIAKSFSPKTNNMSEVLLDGQNNLESDKTKCVEILRENFDKLLNKPSPTTVDNELAALAQNAVPNPLIADGPPTHTEIRGVIRSLKSRKAAGPDNIPAELFKVGTDQLVPFLADLYTAVWNNGSTPAAWQRANITPIFKKGSRKDPKNYRGIAVLPIIGKILSVIILKRVVDHLEPNIGETQSGFRKGRSTTDNIFILRRLLERRHRYDRDTLMAFLDFSAAFDSVDRQSLWSVLKVKGVPDKLVDLIKNCYESTKCRIKAYNQLSEEFCVNTGVRQGDVLSPLLFLLAVERIMSLATGDGDGLLVGEDFSIASLEYADDVVLIAERVDLLQKHITAVEEAAEPFGLKLNHKKCKVIATIPTVPPLKVSGAEIETVPSFNYLGSHLKANGDAETEVTARIGRAHAAFKNNSAIWKRRNVSLKVKNRLFDSLILSTLLYGLETITLSVAISRKLQTFENDCVRALQNVTRSERISNQVVYSRSGRSQSVLELLRLRRLQYLGHVSRMANERLPKSILFSGPPANWRRRPGGQKQSWMELVENGDLKEKLTIYRNFHNYDFGSVVKDLAANRAQWRQFIR